MMMVFDREGARPLTDAPGVADGNSLWKLVSCVGDQC
jgi:hypothetical protein